MADGFCSDGHQLFVTHISTVMAASSQLQVTARPTSPACLSAAPLAQCKSVLAVTGTKLHEVFRLGLICVESCNLIITSRLLNHLAFKELGCLASHGRLEQFHLSTTSSVVRTFQCSAWSKPIRCSRCLCPQSCLSLSLYCLVRAHLHCRTTQIRFAAHTEYR